MRVICVTLEDFTNGQAIGEIAGLMNVGDDFKVIAQCVGYGKNDIEVACYEFAEFRNTNMVFDQRNFAILPDTEPETVTEEETLLTTV